MSTVKRVIAGCLLLPVLLVASCAGKIYLDRKMYELPGEVLKSPARPTRKLNSAMQVAEALDAYVQPRFEILRDKNFGALRIVYRKHAGIVQLKVDAPREKELIANVNAAHRDYAISLLHCAPKPEQHVDAVTPTLQLLYFNQEQVASDWDLPSSFETMKAVTKHKLNWEAIEKKSIAALPHLMAGGEYRTGDASWTILMRPVLASKPACLSCHTDAKLGAVLGVMVYAVRTAEHNTSATIGRR